MFCKPRLLIPDETGYFPLDKSFGDWGDIFSDQILATAILDRLLHHSTALSIRGNSYRLREKRKAGVFHGLTDTAKEV